MDPDIIAARIAARLIARRETVAVSESSAGGMISAALLRIPGASAYFLGGSVVYTKPARLGLLGIDDARMAGIRGASEPYVELLATVTRERLGCTWALVEAGAAGPAGNRYGDAAGHSCLAVIGPEKRLRTIETASDDRAANMVRFAAAALTLLEEALAAA